MQTRNIRIHIIHNYFHSVPWRKVPVYWVSILTLCSSFCVFGVYLCLLKAFNLSNYSGCSVYWRFCSSFLRLWSLSWFTKHSIYYSYKVNLLSKFLEAMIYSTGGHLFTMTEDDIGYAAIFAPYPSSYLSTMGAIFDSVNIKNLQHAWS